MLQGASGRPGSIDAMEGIVVVRVKGLTNSLEWGFEVVRQAWPFLGFVRAYECTEHRWVQFAGLTELLDVDVPEPGRFEG